MHIPNQELKLVPMLRPATFLSLVLPLPPLLPLHMDASSPANPYGIDQAPLLPLLDPPTPHSHSPHHHHTPRCTDRGARKRVEAM